MTRSSRHTARSRALAAITLGATAVAGSALLAPGTSSASSHREAPFTAADPAIDNTDVYAFTSPDKASTATLIANWTPFQEPAGGPNFYPWATDAAYDINIDNNGDAKPDITYRWTFTDVDKRGNTSHGDKVPGTFLYNDGPVTSFDDANLLFKQTYKLEKITYPGGVASSTVLLPNGEVAPSNVGTASIPDYSALRKEAVTSGTIGTGAAQAVSYVGQIADPFFLDLRVFDLLYGADLKETGFNTLKNFNVNTIAFQVPKADLAAGGDATANPVVGVWSTTSRSTTRVLAATDSSGSQSTSSGALAQVSRLGNPLVNEAVVPAQLKDLFNRSTPAQDVAHGFAGKVQDPELPYLINGIYKIPNPNGTAAGKDRPDLVEAFLTGISKKAAAGTDFGGLAKGSVSADLNSLDLNAVANGANPVAQQPAEYLRLNMSVPVTAKPDRLGVLKNDFQGFPNGRRLGDDVIDIALQALEGVLVSDQPAAVKSAVAGLGDGVNGPDRPFLSTFPYVADPYSGSDQHNGTTILFRQVFTSHGGFIQAGITNLSTPQPGATAELYRKNDATGRYDLIATQKLDAAGNATAAPVNVPQKKGTAAVYTWKVLINHGTGAGVFPGIAVKVSSF
ncbi:MAG: hypothetical protein JWO12_1638 [Frankiales bacterium]|nr:hypothetical protein [Frankiales bacterium]